MSDMTAAAYVSAYLDEMADTEISLERLVVDRSGLDTTGMLEAIADERFREPGRQPLALQMMCDLMAPEGSMYFDAIFGDFHGQLAIRNWLLPAMATIDFIEFVPTAEPAMFDDGATSLDEWQMFAKLGEVSIPLSRGVSVRHYRDGWIRSNADVYDTGPFRVPPPTDMPIELPDGEEPEPLPEWPRTNWTTDTTQPEVPVASLDLGAIGDEFASDAVLHDPIAGELRGRAAIGAWFVESLEAAGNVVFEPLGPRHDDGTTSVWEWQLKAVQPDGTRVFVTRGTSVRRRADGLITEASEYYDTASLTDPGVVSSMRAAGATLPGDELVARYRPV